MWYYYRNIYLIDKKGTERLFLIFLSFFNKYSEEWQGKTKGHRSDLKLGWLPYSIWSPAHPSKLNRRLDSCLFLSHNLYHGFIDTHAVGWIWMIFIVNKLKKIAAYAAPECVKLIKYKRGWLHNKLKYLRCTTTTWIHLEVKLYNANSKQYLSTI